MSDKTESSKKSSQKQPKLSTPTTPQTEVEQPSPQSVLPSSLLLQRLQSSPGTMPPEQVLQLQRLVGNRATGRLLGREEQPMKPLKPIMSQTTIQPKLQVGPPNDQYEQEADRVAEQVMRMPTQTEALQMQPVDTLQRDGGGAGFTVNDTFQDELKRSGSGQRLPNDIQAEFGSKMGADLSGVRVHTGAHSVQLSRDIGAKAFTHGKDIHFNTGQYNPGSSAGKTLLAHELTHTIQQTGSKKISPSLASEPLIQAKLMTSKQFKAATARKNKRRNKIAKIDVKLKKLEQSGLDSILLSELLNAIDGWLNERGEESERAPGVKQLREQVVEEQNKIAESLSNKVENDQPRTRQRRRAFTGTVTGSGKTYGSNFSDFDSKQYRVSGHAPNRRVEEVKRTTTEDGSVVYYATGLLTSFNGNAPVVAPYPEPISLGNWYPSVTHINGMAVAAKSGILSAMALQNSVNKAIGGKNDVAFGQKAVDILYTYSAKRGNVIVDLVDCIKGKVKIEDEATVQQQTIMLDAVYRKKRVTVSAHSRGTIKTDNAVRMVHKILTEEYRPSAREDPAVEQLYREFVAYYKKNDMGLGIPPTLLAAAAREEKIKQLAKKWAADDMNRYIQLIYAGNAVQHPSSILKTDFYVGGMDPVSFAVGTYSNIGSKLDSKIGTGGHSKSKVHSVGKSKGHGFVGNYVPSVSEKTAQDLTARDDVQQQFLGIAPDRLEELESLGQRARGRRRR